MKRIASLDSWLEARTPAFVLVLAGLGVLVVEGIDYLSGYEVSLSLLYLGPIGIAAWYSGRWPGMVIALLSCLGWYIADWAAGSQYSSPAIPVWNAFIRLGFFVITAELLVALRNSLGRQSLLARTDGLTGLYTRRPFEERLAHDLALAERHRTALSLAYLDVDDFKSINDSRGHATGDFVLSSLGRALSSQTRDVDTAARLGGDEFALILPNTDDRGARIIASKIVREFDEAIEPSGLTVTCSIGILTMLDGHTSAEAATAAADEVMYRVKNGGKGSVAYRVLGEPFETGDGSRGTDARFRVLRDEAGRRV